MLVLLPDVRTVPTRPNAQDRGYNSRWQKARKTYLLHNPMCRMCRQQGKDTPATVVDHIQPHRGNNYLFWDVGNWQSLCATHHNSTKQRDEKRGYSTAIGRDGWPTDTKHPVNQTRTTPMPPPTASRSIRGID